MVRLARPLHHRAGMSQPSSLRLPTLTLLALATQAGCGALTREEATDALDEIKIASQAQALTSGSVELATHFTIGDAIEEAADELRSFIRTQLPCAEVLVESRESSEGGVRLVVTYGANDGECVYRGQVFSGRHTVSIARNDADSVLVDHIWEELSNEKVVLNGTASVEWDFESRTRHVQHNAQWTRLSDGRSGEGSGDRVQSLLDGGVFEGFAVDGSRAWSGPRGNWRLDIDSVEMRWVDPVPQSGTYTLDAPFDKDLSVSFQRSSGSAIEVTIAGPRRSFDFSVVTCPETTASLHHAVRRGALLLIQ